MSGSWVAASVRAKAMARRRLGVNATRRLAALPDLDRALRRLRGTAFADAAGLGMLAEVEHGTHAVVLWELRVLAGWMPASGLGLARALAAEYEVRNVVQHYRTLTGGPPAEPFDVGRLGTAWPRLATTGSVEALVRELGASPWGDPGPATELDVALLDDVLTLACLRRLAGAAEPAATWAAGRAALLAARRLLVQRRGAPPVLIRAAGPLLGSGWHAVGDLDGLLRAVPSVGRWALAGVTDTDGLWRAEARWWARFEADGFRLLRAPMAGPGTVLGAAAVLTTDAWRLRVALADADAGQGPGEVFDVVA